MLLGANGIITAANASARSLWQTAESELVGEHFAGLFAFDVVSNEPDWLEAQWDVLLSAALEQSIPLQAQPREGAVRPVRVRLEKALAVTPGYFALVETPGAGSTTPHSSSAIATPTRADGPALLAEKGAAGFFDLHFKDNRIYYSPAWKKLLGYVDAELPNTYDTWLKLIHPEDSGAAPDKLAKKPVVGTRPFTVEFRMKHRHGHDVWIQSIGLQIVGEDGTLERVVGTHL
ncbi:MAG: PAS domain-containing protein, partial [Pseudomonadota bacterium]